MDKDICLNCDDGIVNIRVGAIIIKDNCFLMVGSKRVDYLYSVGGRIKFGESAEQAVIREVFEETGVKMEIDRLGFIHENFFNGDGLLKAHKPVYEISFFFYMKVPADFSPVSGSFDENGAKEYLKWVPLGSDIKMFPSFFKTELKSHSLGVKHFLTDDR